MSQLRAIDLALAPDKRRSTFVVRSGEVLERLRQLLGAAKARAGQGFSGEDAEPDLHLVKRRFSEFPSELACNQEYAGGLEQGLDDEAEPVVAQREAPVFEHPSIAALHRPAPLAEP